MARGLGVKTVAEAVADEGAATTLREIGVDLAQGPWFGMPENLEAALGADGFSGLESPSDGNCKHRRAEEHERFHLPTE